MKKVYYNVDKKITVGKVLDVLSKYPDRDICMYNEDGVIIEYIDKDAISLEGMSYFYYIDEFETIERYKEAFDNSLIYSDIKAKHLVEVLSSNKDRYVSVIGSDSFTIYVDDENIIFDCILCGKCFKDEVGALKEANEYEIYEI